MLKSTQTVFPVSGMMCPACEAKIERAVKKLDGVVGAKADYVRSCVTINCEYVHTVQFEHAVKKAVSNAGYSIQSLSGKETWLGILRFACAVILLYGLYRIASNFGWLDVFYHFPQAEETASFTAIFLIGIFTSVHCIGMCGGINLSVSCARGVQGTVIYNLARVVSYTIIGGIVGAIGSVVGFSGTARGIIAIAGGIFMLIMGLNMLNLFPFLRVLTLRFKLPAFLANVFARAGNSQKSSRKQAVIVGLLNGLLPCGPLQTMQFLALSSGSVLKGALSMFLFSAGTLPLMIAFGSIGSLLTSKTTKILTSVSALLILALGIELVKTGLSMSNLL